MKNSSKFLCLLFVLNFSAYASEGNGSFSFYKTAKQKQVNKIKEASSSIQIFKNSLWSEFAFDDRLKGLNFKGDKLELVTNSQVRFQEMKKIQKLFLQETIPFQVKLNQVTKKQSMLQSQIDLEDKKFAEAKYSMVSPGPALINDLAAEHDSRVVALNKELIQVTSDVKGLLVQTDKIRSKYSQQLKFFEDVQASKWAMKIKQSEENITAIAYENKKPQNYTQYGQTRLPATQPNAHR